MNIQETIKKIQDAPGSIFTKEDVIKILNGVTTEEGKIPSLKRLKEKILDSIENSIQDVEEYVDKRWETHERSESVIIEVELDIDTDGIISQVKSEVEEAFEEFEEEYNQGDEEEETEEEEAN